MLIKEHLKVGFVTHLIFIEISAQEHGNDDDDFRYGTGG